MPVVKILDAGHGTRLSKYVGDVDGHPLWVSRFIVDNPEAVVQSHLDFIEAGSDVFQSFTYQATVEGFMKHFNVNENVAKEYIENGGKLALKARDIYLKNHPDAEIEVFGSIGPYGVIFHDGSEYTGSYTDNVTIEEIKDSHRSRMLALMKAGLDRFSFETIPSEKEAQAVVELLKEFPNTKAWISFVCKDNQHTAYGDNFSETVKFIYEQNPMQIVAIGVNCLDPAHICDLFKDINKDRKTDDFIPLIAYPNKGGVIYTTENGYVEQKDAPPLQMMMKDWIDLGARYIGGCCTTCAEDIPLWKREVKKWKNV